jgi:hypothetical protein
VERRAPVAIDDPDPDAALGERERREHADGAGADDEHLGLVVS